MGSNSSNAYSQCLLSILSKRIGILGGACFLCIICSCNSNPRQEQNSGIKEVSYKAEDPPKYGTIALEFEEEFVLGKDPEGNDFAYRSDIEVDSKGTIYVLDYGMKEVVVFDSTGQRVGTIGREGSGPGEFSRPLQTNLVSDDELFVVEIYRIHSFHADGTVRFTQRNEGVLIRFQALINGGRLGVISKTVDDKILETLVVLDSLNQITRENDDIPTMLGPRTTLSDGSPLSVRVNHIYTPRFILSAIQPDRLIYANTHEYALNVLDSRGDTLRIISRDLPKAPISKKQKETVIESVSKNPTARTWPKHLLKEAIYFPDSQPFFWGVITDDKERIYVFLANMEADQVPEHNSVDIFSKDGTYLYQAKSEVSPSVIRNGKAYGITVDQRNGNPTVTCWTITNWSDLKYE